MGFDQPILFLIFNRPDTTERVFNQIKKVKPKKLYVSADGPRLNVFGEYDKCLRTRNIIASQIDWDCDVKTLYRDVNLGCGIAVSQGISWFFEHEEEGIILEDDTLVDVSFFHFAAELLVRYRDNLKITSISAANLMADKTPIPMDSYTFSNYGGIWGWASWRRAWQGYDYYSGDWNNLGTRVRFLFRFGLGQTLFFHSLFKKVTGSVKLDTWDYQWWYHQLYQNGLTVIPGNNLMCNIGFGSGATHTSEIVNPDFIVPVEAIIFPLRHPLKIRVDNVFEALIVRRFYSLKLTAVQKMKLLSRLIFNS